MELSPSPTEILTDQKIWPQQIRPHSTDPSQAIVDQAFEDIIDREFDLPIYEYGNPDLPVAPYREYFIDTVRENPVTVVSSATGSGKSTQFCQYLLEAGFSKVINTQPRILAARSTAERVQEELTRAIGTEAEDWVGYSTATEGNEGPTNKIVFPTDGLQLMREVSGDGTKSNEVLIIDEAHEANLNMEMLGALVRQRIAQDPNFRAVIMSATISTRELADSFINPHTNKSAPIIEMPGRTYDVTEYETQEDVAELAYRIAKESSEAEQHKRILIFVPSKDDIKRVTGELKKKSPAEYAIIPLHGDQTPQQQAKVFIDQPKIIVATDIAKTSITIPDLDVVIDSGWERAGTYEDEVCGLDEQPANIATQEQRRGRVGRTKEGEYWLAGLRTHPPLPPPELRPAYGSPEIHRRPLTNALGALALGSYGIEGLQFTHPPTESAIQAARNELRRLGALSSDSELNDIGRSMVALPVDASYARMIVESRKHGATTRLHVAAAAAIQQVNGMLYTEPESTKHWRKLSSEQSSDFKFELDVFIALLAKEQVIPQDLPEEKRTEAINNLAHIHDVVAGRYQKAKTTFFELCEREGLDPSLLAPLTKDQRALLMRCQIAGAPEIFQFRGGDTFSDRRGDRRKVGNRSTMNGLVGIMVGKPFNLRSSTRSGYRKNYFISGGSVVSLRAILETAPHRISRRPLRHSFTPDGSVLTTETVYFDDSVYIGEDKRPAEPSRELQRFIVHSLMNGGIQDTNGNTMPPPFALPAKSRLFAERLQAARELQHRTNFVLDVEKRFGQFVTNVVNSIPEDAMTIEAIDNYVPTINLSNLVRPSKRKNIKDIRNLAPDSITINDRPVSITYNNAVAYVALPPDLKYAVTAETFASLGVGRHINIRTGKRGRYARLGDFLLELSQKPRKVRRTPPELLMDGEVMEPAIIPDGGGKPPRPSSGATKRNRRGTPMSERTRSKIARQKANRAARQSAKKAA